MANFSLVIATVKSAYDTYLTANATLAQAEADIIALGAAPTKPTIVNANADWNSYVTSLDTWNASNTTLHAAYKTASDAARTAELAVIAALGYGTGDTLDSIVFNQWVHLTGSGAGILTYSHWVGVAADFTHLTVSTSLPTKAFPNT
jgi:hypothetical protein